MIPQIIKSKIRSQLGKDIIWTLVGQVVVMICGLVITKVLSNGLSIDGYGQYNVIKRSSSVMSFCLLGGLGITLPRYLAIYVHKLHFRRIKSIILSTTVYMVANVAIISIAYAILKPFISSIVSGSDNWYVYLLILMYSLMVAISSYLCAYYRGLGNFKQSNISHIVFQLAAIIPLVYYKNNIITIVECWTVLNFILVLYYVYKERIKYRSLSPISVKAYYHQGDIKKTSIYSIPRTLGDFFLFSYSAFPLLYIGNRMNMEAVSYFSVGMTLYTMVTPIFSFLGVILLPMISKMVDERQFNNAYLFIKRINTIYIILAIIITSVMVFFMEWIIPIFFSKEYLTSLNVTKVLILAILPESLYLLYRNPIDAISVKPYNTFILGGCFLFLIIGFIYAKTLEQFAYIYLVVATLRGCFSFLAWRVVVKSQIIK